MKSSTCNLGRAVAACSSLGFNPIKRRGSPQAGRPLSGLRAAGSGLGAGLLALLGACSGGGNSGNASSGLSAQAQIGEQAFFDTALSASGQQACGTCHLPDKAFTDGLVVSIGGPLMNQSGFRNAPTVLYASYSPSFHLDTDGAPVGGQFRDGRALDLAAQAQGPFLNPVEMANSDAAELLGRLSQRPYFQQFVALYGNAVSTDASTALADLGQAIAAFEREDARFHPFSSKFDYYLKGKASLSSQELNGFALFNDPTHGNCAACHLSTSADGVTPPLFTDFSYDNLGLPRNSAIPANSDADAPASTPQNSTDGLHTYYDLGFCGPFRSNPVGSNYAPLCGQFKVPTLRDIALTAPYFHNGEFTTLQQAVSFYVQRDTNPELWYPASPDNSAQVVKFDDLPALYGGQFAVTPDLVGSDAGYYGNVNTTEIPYNRVIGSSPALNTSQIDDLIAFLCTLTDGYQPSAPDAYASLLPAQCPQHSGS